MDNCIVFVINLEHSSERLSGMQRQLDALGLSWQRVPAIHGEMLSEAQRVLFDAQGYRRKHGKTVNFRELGCYLSHLEAMKTLLRSSFEHAVVLEDDVIVGTDLQAVMDELIRNSTLWDMAKLSSIHSGSPKPIQVLTKEHDLCVMFSRCTGASAYAVNRKAAQVYLNQLLPMQLPYDHVFDRGWAMGIKVRKVHPDVCTHSYAQGSTIDLAPQAGRRTDTVKFPWYQRLSVYRYRLGNELRRLSYGIASFWRHALRR